MIAYLFAVPEEASDLIGQLEDVDRFEIAGLHCTLGKLGRREVLVGIIGMGLSNAHDRTEVLFQYFRPKCVVHAGFGGALVPSLKRGDVLLSENLTTDNLSQFARVIDDIHFARFTSRDHLVSTPEDRRSLAEDTGCHVIDMESTAVAKIVDERGIYIASLRVISDEFNDNLPTSALEAAYDRRKEKARPFALALHLLFHPWQIGPFIRFVSRMPKLRARLTNVITSLTDEFPGSW